MGDRERWDARWRERGEPGTPSRALLDLERFLPARGRALDVGGGAGRHAVWLAGRGFDVTIADVSPEGLRIASDAASSAGLPLSTVAIDLEREPLPEGPWDVIVQHHFLHRPLFAAFPCALAPCGTLFVVHPTRRNLERHEHPSVRFLLDEGELRGLVGALDVVHEAEGWSVEARHEAVIVAVKAPL